MQPVTILHLKQPTNYSTSLKKVKFVLAKITSFRYVSNSGMLHTKSDPILYAYILYMQQLYLKGEKEKKRKECLHNYVINLREELECLDDSTSLSEGFLDLFFINSGRDVGQMKSSTWGVNVLKVLEYLLHSQNIKRYTRGDTHSGMKNSCQG